MSGDRPKLALYWAASCGGCEIAVLGIEEEILDVARAFDIVFWPCVMDFKVRDIERMPDRSIDVCLFNGGIRTSEQEYMARLLRARSKVLVAFGSCAHEGCIPGLANLHDGREILEAVYRDSPSLDNPRGILPRAETEVEEGTLRLPVFYDTLETLGQAVDVDYFLPGCPPEPARIREALAAISAGTLPQRGSVIGVDTTVCDECPRVRHEKAIQRFRRTWEIIPDEGTCLLEQGIVCCGIATRAGCSARCPRVNSPCIGCYGPNDGVWDFGARMMSALASVIDSRDPEEIDRIIREGIPDPVGTFYRFGLAHGLLRRGKPPASASAGGEDRR
jgi:F420-non-reducing hydrogenase small subunit